VLTKVNTIGAALFGFTFRKHPPWFLNFYLHCCETHKWWSWYLR